MQKLDKYYLILLGVLLTLLFVAALQAKKFDLQRQIKENLEDIRPIPTVSMCVQKYTENRCME